MSARARATAREQFRAEVYAINELLRLREERAFQRFAQARPDGGHEPSAADALGSSHGESSRPPNVAGTGDAAPARVMAAIFDLTDGDECALPTASKEAPPEAATSVSTPPSALLGSLQDSTLSERQPLAQGVRGGAGWRLVAGGLGRVRVSVPAPTASATAGPADAYGVLSPSPSSLRQAVSIYRSDRIGIVPRADRARPTSSHFSQRTPRREWF